MTRKLLSGVLAVLLCATLLVGATACNPPPTTATPTTAPTATGPAGETPTPEPTDVPLELIEIATGNKIPAPSNFDFKDKTLYGLGIGGGADVEIIIETIKEHYDIDIVKIEYSTGSVAEILQSRIASGERTDMVNGLYPDFAVQGLIQPVDGLIDYSLDITKRNAETYDKYQFDGSHWAFVIDDIATSNIFYNTKFFDENNLDHPRAYYDRGEWDWNALLDLATKLTVDENKDGTPEIYGLTSCNWHTARLAFSTGQNVINIQDGKFVSNIANTAYSRAFQFMYDLFYTYRVTDPNRDVAYVQSMFNRGETPMLMISAWMGINGLFLGKIKNQDLLGYVPYPRDPDSDEYYVAGTPIVMQLPAGSENVDAVRAWIYSAALYYYEQNTPGTPGYIYKREYAQERIPNLTDEMYERYALWYDEYNQLKKVPEIYNAILDVDNQLFVGMIGTPDNPTQQSYQQVVAAQEPLLNDRLAALGD